MVRRRYSGTKQFSAICSFSVDGVSDCLILHTALCIKRRLGCPRQWKSLARNNNNNKNPGMPHFCMALYLPVSELTCKSCFPLFSLLMYVSPICCLLDSNKMFSVSLFTVYFTESNNSFTAIDNFSCTSSNRTYNNQNIWWDAWDFCCHEMPVFFSWEVSSVQNLQRERIRVTYTYM